MFCIQISLGEQKQSQLASGLYLRVATCTGLTVYKNLNLYFRFLSHSYMDFNAKLATALQKIPIYERVLAPPVGCFCWKYLCWRLTIHINTDDMFANTDKNVTNTVIFSPTQMKIQPTQIIFSPTQMTFPPLPPPLITYFRQHR